MCTNSPEHRDTSKPDVTKRIVTKEEYEADQPAVINNEKSIKASDKKLSLINAAEIVLKACERPLSCKEIIEKAIDANIWKSGNGLTPSNTLYASISREIKVKGTESRFIKAAPGKFSLKC